MCLISYWLKEREYCTFSNSTALVHALQLTIRRPVHSTNTNLMKCSSRHCLQNLWPHIPVWTASFKGKWQIEHCKSSSTGLTNSSLYPPPLKRNASAILNGNARRLSAYMKLTVPCMTNRSCQLAVKLERKRK